MAIPDDIAEALVSAHERMDAQFKRIEQIEKILSEDGVTADGFDKRIRELESQWSKEISKHMALVEQHNKLVLAVNGDSAEMRDLELTKARYDVQEWLPNIAERDRQGRWHATRDAVVPECYRQLTGVTDDHERADRACVMADIVADRAHGPLEIVVPAGTQFDAAALAQGGKFVSQPGWSQWDAKVEALVKAAKRHLCGHTRADHRNECGCTTCELAGAIKPFEASRGGE